MSMQLQIAGKYQLLHKIGAGAFGEIWQAQTLQTNDPVAVKLEPVDVAQPQLQQEYKMYKLLVGQPGTPYVYHYSVEDQHNVLVMELLGPSLEDLFGYCKRIFSLKTTAMLGDQMVQRLEYLHSKTFIHRDQKPDNYCIGRGRAKKQVYLIDYGLAKRYIIHQQHIQYKEHKALTGTVRYCSINTQLGIEQSRRDDLESLGYILIYFSKGFLPWQGMRANDKKQRYEKILEKKLSVSVEQLARGLPTQFAAFLYYCKSLRFDDNPDYFFLKNLFQTVLEQNQLQNDLNYDWSRFGVDTDNHCNKKSLEQYDGNDNYQQSQKQSLSQRSRVSKASRQQSIRENVRDAANFNFNFLF